MAEALGIASGIAGLISLTIEVFGISYKYINGVRNASSSARQFLSELENLKIILAQVGKMTKETHQEVIFGDDGSCLLSIKDSHEYCLMLRKVRDKLIERQSESSFRTKFRTLTWPFSEKETLAFAESLHRYIGIYTAALAADGRTVAMLSLTEIRESKMSQQSVEMEDVLDWLSPWSMYQKQQDIFSRRQSSTGSWLLRDAVFQDWEKSENSHPTLWCPGDPGTGKTVMTSLVVDYLVKSYASEDIRIAYVYCDYKDQVAQTASNLIACLIRQIIGHSNELPQQLEQLHKELKIQSRRPSFNELKRLLEALCGDRGRIYLLVDALDECEAKERRLLLPLFDTLLRRSTRLFVTSRPNNEDIFQTFVEASRITISASESDLREYITERINERKEIINRLTPELKQNIVSTISVGASGMFLLAALQIDRIFNARTVKGIKSALTSMPAELDEVYRQTLERIRKQAGDDGPLGMRILSWISHARRPLSVDELRHGLAVEYDGNEEKPNEFDEDNMHLSESLVDVCAGLVIIDSSSRIIRLVHYTTQEYLDKERLHIFPNAEVDISRACLMFLSYDSTRTWKNPKTWVNTSRNFSPLRGRLQARDHLVFADYATYHWFSHVKSGLQARDPDPVFLKAVADFKTIDSMASSISNLNFWATIESDRTTEALPLEVASYLGLEELVIVLLDQKTGSCTGSDRSLGLASSNGYLNVVKLLLEKGAQVDSTIEVRGHRDVRRITALGAACKAGDLSVAESLIEKGADIHGGDLAVLSPIHVAAWHNRPMLVDFLLKKGVNPNARDADGRTACHFAAMDGSLDSVKILIDAHGDLELKDNNGWTVLHHAVDTYIATKRQRNMVKFLLDRGIDASAKDKRGELASNILGNKLSRFARFHRSSYELEMGKQLRQRMLELEHKSSTRAASGVPIHR